MKVISEDSNLVVLPPAVMRATATAMGMIPNPWLSVDMDVRRKGSDVIMPAGAPGFEEVGITETMVMEDLAERYLVRFRQMSEFVDEDEGDLVRQPR